MAKNQAAGLYDDVRSGKPRTIDDERVAQLIRTTLHTKPANGSTHWCARTVAAETGISKTSVARCFQLFGLQPHRTEGRAAGSRAWIKSTPARAIPAAQSPLV